MTELGRAAAEIRAAIAPLTAQGWGVLLDPIRVRGLVHVTVMDGTPVEKRSVGADTLAALKAARTMMGLPA